jgi:hypothetical protein
LRVVNTGKNSPSFMKSERLLPRSLGAFKLSYPELVECTYMLTVCKVHFNIILPSRHQSETNDSYQRIQSDTLRIRNNLPDVETIA